LSSVLIRRACMLSPASALVLCCCFVIPLYRPSVPPALHSFPTRRSSDLRPPAGGGRRRRDDHSVDLEDSVPGALTSLYTDETMSDRKSTRLNSSHVSISYAVFCLKKTTIATTLTINAATTVM